MARKGVYEKYKNMHFSENRGGGGQLILVMGLFR